MSAEQLALEAILPPFDSEERAEYLKAAMRVIARAILDHSDGSSNEALLGFTLLCHQEAIPILMKESETPR